MDKDVQEALLNWSTSNGKFSGSFFMHRKHVHCTAAPTYTPVMFHRVIQAKEKRKRLHSEQPAIHTTSLW